MAGGRRGGRRSNGNTRADASQKIAHIPKGKNAKSDRAASDPDLPMEESPIAKSGSSHQPNTLDDIVEIAESFARQTASGGKAQVKTKRPKEERRRMTEKEEDDLIIQDEEDTEQAIIRLDAQPPNIKNGTMKPYQIAGLNWLIGLYETKVNGILADEMGLGKTLQTIALVAYMRQYRDVTGPHLIVVPKSTMGNWRKEFGRWCPDVEVLILHGNKDERADLIQERVRPEAFDVLITSYEMVLREKGEIRRHDWHLLVIDEAHRLKNECSILSQVLRQFKTRARLLITGTPLQNNLHELWALLNFLMPELFDSSGEFDAFLDVEHSENPKELLSRLHAILRPFLLRRLKSEVARELPPKKETILYVGMSAIQKETYRSVLMRDFAALQGSSRSKTRLLNIVMQLRKAANHPYLFEGVEDRSLPAYGEHMIENCGKMVVLDKLLIRLKETGHRVLIFSQMTRQLDILEDYCVFRNFGYCRIDGSTASEDRERSIADFNSENSSKFLFLLSTRAGGLGVNLQTADIVILYDSDWNPQMDLQAQDRAHRIGQKRPVSVYRLVTENTIEEKVVERAELKLRLDALVIQQGRLAERSTKVSKEEMASMIRYGADEIFRSKDSTITDEDIEQILFKGEQKTAEMSDKLKLLTDEVNLAGFSMDGATGTDADAYLTLAGHSDNNTKDMQMNFLTKVTSALGKRDRQKSRSSYDVNQYYRQLMNIEKKKRRATVPRPKRLPPLYDYQFFQQKRLMQLCNREMDHWARSMDFPENSDNVPPPLSDEEEKEKLALLSQGFGNWSKRDFHQFLRACERYGHKNIEAISKSVNSKTPEEVQLYHLVFWERYKEIDGWEKMLAAINRGESKLTRLGEIQNAIARKLAGISNPMDSLDIKYSTQHKGKGFTEENDRYLIVQVGALGYGEWDRIHCMIRQDRRFMFDYFFKSRSPAELNRRLDSLVRLIEKENDSKGSDDKPKTSKIRKNAQSENSSLVKSEIVGEGSPLLSKRKSSGRNADAGGNSTRKKRRLSSHM